MRFVIFFGRRLPCFLHLPLAIVSAVLSLLLVPAPAHSQQPSPDTAEASQPTTPSAEFVLQTLRPLIIKAMEQSESSDQKSADLQKQIDNEAAQSKSEAEQRQNEEEQRMKEQEASRKAFEQLSSQADRLQSFFDALSLKLTAFSASEADKEKAALESIDLMIADAKRQEETISLLKIGCITLGITTTAGIVYAVGHAAHIW